jgi:hypothetical protein
MKKTILVLFCGLFSTQVFAQKEPEEFPWTKAAKIISADEAKKSPRKKEEQQTEADAGKLDKKADAEKKKSK